MSARFHIAVAAPVMTAIACAQTLASAPQPRDRTSAPLADTAESALPRATRGCTAIAADKHPEPEGSSCYPDCNADGVLTVSDFGCFQTRFAAGNAYADCNGDSLLTVADFGCFQTMFVLGCP